MAGHEGDPSPYDANADLYDAWSRSVTEDVGFYVDEARRVEGPVVELGTGTGRITVPIAASGQSVIGVDNSAGMLDVCRAAAELAGVSELVDLRLGDLRDPPVAEAVELVLCPFRAYLHLETDAERLRGLRAARVGSMRTPRSSTVTIVPRMLISPRTYGGAPGMRVSFSRGMISCA